MMQDQLPRRAVLSLVVDEQPHPSRFSSSNDYYQVGVNNGGNKTCQCVYWRTFIPEHESRRIEVDPRHPVGSITVDGVDYLEFAGLFKRPIRPGRSGFLLHLKVARQGVRRQILIRWFLVSADGRVPHQNDTLATLPIEISAAD
jgi:hypothetical protein